jgi:hypothetical protein
MRAREQAQPRRALSPPSKIGWAIRAIAIVVLVLFQGCESIPSLSRPSTGVRVYQLLGFQGVSFVFDADQRNLRSVLGPCDGTWDNCASSIRVSQQ